MLRRFGLRLFKFLAALFSVLLFISIILMTASDLLDELFLSGSKVGHLNILKPKDSSSPQFFGGSKSGMVGWDYNNVGRSEPIQNQATQTVP